MRITGRAGTPRTRAGVVAVVVLIASAGVSAPGFAAPGCLGADVTITARPGVPTVGTPGPDVILGTNGPDVIDGGGGDDRICSRGGADRVNGGAGNDIIVLGGGNDLGIGGPGADSILGRTGRDTLRGNRGSDELEGGPGRDRMDGGPGRDGCDGGAGADVGERCRTLTASGQNLDDTFAGNGDLRGYTTNNRNALPEVGRLNGRYFAALSDNSNNRTLHFNQDQGRLDAKLVEFPFDVVVRNIGIGTFADSQSAPVPDGNAYVFAGVQVHVTDLDDRNSSHVVVGHRGGTRFTVEGKNTVDGDSSVNDIGADAVPAGRADIRIVGNRDRTLTVHWQPPNPAPGTQPDRWTLYRGTGELPGPAPTYGPTVYIGLITYAFGSNGVPFAGTADAIEG